MTNNPASAAETTALPPDHGLQQRYMSLKVLLGLRWEDNPKLHQSDLIEHSVQTYGFNDPVGVDYDHELLTEGHGRLELLERMFKADPNLLPRNIMPVFEGPRGERFPSQYREAYKYNGKVVDWLVPSISLVFADKNAAMLYALLHNRAGVTHFAPEDYDMARLRKALNTAGATQAGLPGFGTEDLVAGSGIGSAGAGQKTGPIAELPALPAFDEAYKPFDASALPDSPEYQSDQVAQSYVLMVTFPSFEGLKAGLVALTFGQRKTLPPHARFASLEGGAMLGFWEAALANGMPELQAGAASSLRPAAPLVGQVSLDGTVVGRPDLVLEQVDEFDPGLPEDAPAEDLGGVDEALAGPQTPQGEASASWEEGGVKEPPVAEWRPAPDPVGAPSSAPKKAKPQQPGGPVWVGQLCKVCGGSGFTGWRGQGPLREKVVCGSCSGAGDKATYDAQHKAA